MFTTYPQAELWLGTLAGLRGQRTWSFVEQDGLAPWFYVQIGRRKQSANETYMLMLGSTAELGQLVEEQSDSMWLERAYLVSPPSINNTESWLMESLLEIEAVTEADSRRSHVVFKMTNGNLYSLEDYPLARVAKDPIIFSAKCHVKPRVDGPQR
ncbi:hypothetical protein [Pseudomonas knackmussii]|uniref:hypothetical protein n=1 Tax=Pseudomonas knackmussii TaxID=65741 RepID=UPI003F4A0F5F